MSTAMQVVVAYDTRSGQITGVHHGPADPEYDWTPEFDAYLDIAILRAPLQGHTHGKQYAVDTAKNQIIETAAEEGISFGFGQTGGTSHES